jgi:large subunit ribosomal protein L22
LKAIQSAVANIVDRDQSREVNPDQLVVQTIFVDEGPTFKRFLPRAMGRATPIRKRMSHLTVLVSTPAVEAVIEETPETQAAEAAKKTRIAAKKAAASSKTGGAVQKAKTTKQRKTD